MAPIIAHVTTATTPNPPFILPIKTFTKSSKCFAIPLSLITPPARIKRGIANNIGFIT